MFFQIRIKSPHITSGRVSFKMSLLRSDFVSFKLFLFCRLEPSESLEENQRNLLQMTEKFFHAIVSSSLEFPPQLRSVCHCLYQVCLKSEITIINPGWTGKMLGWRVSCWLWVCLFPDSAGWIIMQWVVGIGFERNFFFSGHFWSVLNKLL